MRIYDPRLGRFLSVDPLTKEYSMLTPYQFASNRPIDGIDLDGLEFATDVSIDANTGDGFPLLKITTYIRVKVINESKIITSPEVVKAKAELFKASVEKKMQGEDCIWNETFNCRINTIVILDYTPEDKENDGNIGYLIFDDRTSTKTGTTVTKSGTTTTTTTTVATTPGDTQGETNLFRIRIGITMDGALVKEEEFKETSVHEAGHAGGINHPWNLSPLEANHPSENLSVINQNNPTTADKKAIKENFMNSNENPDANYRSNGGERVLFKQLYLIALKTMLNSYYTKEDVLKTSTQNIQKPKAN